MLKIPLPSPDIHNEIFIKYHCLYYKIVELIDEYQLPYKYLLQYLTYKTAYGLYIKLPNNLLCVNISKCACSFVKNAAYYNIYNTLPDISHKLEVLYPMKNRTIHLGYGMEKHIWNNGYLDINKFEKFAIYRDPVERVISAYINKVKQHWIHYYFRRLDISSSFTDFLFFIKVDLNKQKINGIDYSYIEEHIRPQSLYYNENDIDYIVKIEDIKDFFKSKNIDYPDNIDINSSNYSNINMKEFEPYYDEIRELYKEDYKILNKYKVWSK